MDVNLKKKEQTIWKAISTIPSSTTSLMIYLTEKDRLNDCLKIPDYSAAWNSAEHFPSPGTFSIFVMNKCEKHSASTITSLDDLGRRAEMK